MSRNTIQALRIVCFICAVVTIGLAVAQLLIWRDPFAAIGTFGAGACMCAFLKPD